MKIVSAGKKLVDKLVEECTENVEKVKLAKITLTEDENKYKCSSCTWYMCYFQYFLQLTLELVLILFIFIGTQRKMLLLLSLVPVLKQQFDY